MLNTFDSLFDENEAEEFTETLYYAEEIIKILSALDHVYQSKGFLGKLFYKPWHDALITAAKCFNPELSAAYLEGKVKPPVSDELLDSLFSNEKTNS